MAKGYWVAAYRDVHDPERLQAYAELAGPAVEAAGGRFLVRGGQLVTHEGGVAQRTVVVEFDSFDQAVAAYERADYQAALAALDGGAERDIRIVEGV